MTTVQCHNPRCRKAFTRPKGSKIAYHSVKCRHDADLARRRARSHRTPTMIAQCNDCQVSVNLADLALHDECEGLDVWSEDTRTCLECGDPAPPGRKYCSDTHWLAYWRRELGDSSLTPEGVAYREDYALANGLFGTLPSASYEDLFGTHETPKTGFHAATRGDFGAGSKNLY